MQLNWKYAESTVRPLELDETSSPTTVYFNRNITEVEREQPEGDSIIMYEFETASLSQDEYKMYLIEKERSDIDYIAMMTDVDLEEV